MSSNKELNGPTVAWFPAPVVLVSCAYKEVTNIITIAWTGVVCSKPPLVSISIRPSRFSYELISNSGEFIVNIPTSHQLEETKICGSKSGKNTDKWATCSFTPVKGTKVSAPLIKECPINIECKVVKMIANIGVHTIFIGEVQEVHVDPQIAPKSVLDITPLCYSPKAGIFGKSISLNEEI